MTPKLNQYLNRTIMVSIPALFKHGKCQPCTLHSVEADGLWLVSADLVDKLLAGQEDAGAATQPVYVSNAHIAALILPAQSPAATPGNVDAKKTRAPETPKSASPTT
jgi:hypothetical protein